MLSKQKRFWSIRTDAIFAIFEAPPCKVIHIMFTLRPYIEYRNHYTPLMQNIQAQKLVNA